MVEPWLDTSTLAPDTVRHHPTLRHQCQSTLDRHSARHSDTSVQRVSSHLDSGDVRVVSSSVKAFRHSRHSRHSTPPTPPTPPTPLDTPDTPDTLDTGLSIADILHLSSPLRPAQALPLPPPVLHPVLLPPPLLLPPLSQVLQLLRLPLLTVALREHRRARVPRAHQAMMLACSSVCFSHAGWAASAAPFSCTTACPSPSP